MNFKLEFITTSHQKTNMAFEKPKFHKDIPDWIRWLAQDADGTWWGYEMEPHQHHQGWYENELGRCHRIKKDLPNLDWQHSLAAYSPDASKHD